MRKIIQISESNDKGDWNVTALCDDGTVWHINYISNSWKKLPDIPQEQPWPKQKPV